MKRQAYTSQTNISPTLYESLMQLAIDEGRFFQTNVAGALVCWQHTVDVRAEL